MNKGDWWFKFDMKAWRTDTALGKCSLATKGAWIELLCAMREEGTYEVSGTVEQLARLVGCLPSEMASAIAELESTGTAEVRHHVTECHTNVTLGHEIVTLVSRRLSKELTVKESNKIRKQKQRSNAPVTRVSHERVISKEKEVRSNTIYTPDVTPLGPPSTRGETRARERAATSAKGTRIATDFSPDETALRWASSNHPEVDVAIETEKFVNHFCSVSGVSAVKIDWTAAWRNWIMRSKKEYAKPRQMGNTPKKAGLSEKLRDIEDMLGTYR